MSGVRSESVLPSTAKDVGRWKGRQGTTSGPIALVVDVVGGGKTTVWVVKQSVQQSLPQATLLATLPPLDKNIFDRGIDSWDWDSSHKDLLTLKSTIYYLVDAIKPCHCFATFSWNDQMLDAEKQKNEQTFMINFPEFSTKKRSPSTDGERKGHDSDSSSQDSKHSVLIECFNSMCKLEESFFNPARSFMSVSLDDCFTHTGSFSTDTDDDW
jgi:hypothetical protein